MVRLAEKDCAFWLTEATKTKDEQEKNPSLAYKRFPNRPYIRPLLRALDNEEVLFLEKSRTMMASWTVSGWAAHRMFTRPATGVIFQSEDEDRAVSDVEYVKILWEQSEPELRARWKPEKEIPPFQQSYNYFGLANGSWCLGLPGKPDKIRSQHPTIVVLDEAAHITRGKESFNVAVATRCLHIVCLSSANPGWFQQATEGATPVDWPEYGQEKAA
jgi:hypothetical protein